MWELQFCHESGENKSFFNCKVKKDPITINCKRSSSNEREQAKDCSSEKEHKVNALALGADEGRD